MIIKYLRIILLFIPLSLAVCGWSQGDVLVNTSYDWKADSLFIKKMKKQLNHIRQTEKRPTVALVLAGGGAKGASHIGVLKYLEEQGIPVDFVAGTSMGGLMGGLYSLGYSAVEIDSIVRSIDWNVMMSDNVPREFYSFNRRSYKSTYVIDIPFEGTQFMRSLPSGFMYGLNIYNLMSALSVGYQQATDFTQLPTPYCCVATEIVTQTEKHWTEGSMIDAMRSTMSIPGYFRPVRVDSMILADGGTKNNFPTDIAKAVGADIIIGVELTMPRDYKKVNNVADILMQTAQYSGGLEAHNRNVQNATIYITPDISGYGMLSFGKEEVADLITRGYTEAQKHAREIDSVAMLVGRKGRKLHNTKAINISDTAVRISSVEYVGGLSEKEQRYINQKIRIEKNELCDRKELEIVQSIIYGTMAFTDVTYRLLDDGEGGYKLQFRCTKRPPNSVNIGLRADTEEWFAALVDFGFGQNKIYGHSFHVALRLAKSPYLRLGWTFRPVKGPKVSAEFQTIYRTLYGSDNALFSRNYYEQSLRNTLKLYISDTHWSRVDLKFGARLEHQPFYRIFSETGMSQAFNWRTFHPYLFLRFVFDDEDVHYFPNKGFRVTTSYDYNFKNSHYLAASLRGVIPACSFLAIIPSIRGRYILGKDENYGEMNNYVGGVMEGRYYEHQMPFIGINGEKACHNILTIADVDFRFKVWKNCYLSAVGAVMHNCPLNLKEHNFVYAAALQFGYKSKIGPILANIHWNSFNTKKVGIYLGVGYDF